MNKDINEKAVASALAELRSLGQRMSNHHRWHSTMPPQNIGDEIQKKTEKLAEALGIKFPEPASA